MASHDSISHYRSEDGSLILAFPEEFRTKYWHNQFGHVESIVSSTHYPANRVCFDFSKCTWGDPVPLLSLLLLVKRLSDEQKETIILISDIWQLSEDQVKRKRFIGFLVCEGFMDQFKNAGARIQARNSSDQVSFNSNEITELSRYLLFQDSFISNPILLDLTFPKGTAINEVTGFVKSYMENISHRLKRKVPLHYFKKFNSTLYMFLLETLLNSEEHAYNSSQKKYVTIYLRYRYSLTNAAIHKEQKKILDRTFTAEFTNTPKLEKMFAEETPGFIEVFIFDAGMGIVKSFNSGNSKNSTNEYPFRQVLDSIIKNGDRNIKFRKPTKYGGLYILTRLIERGYLWIRDHNEFFGEELPINLISGVTEEIKSALPPTGLPIIARISWTENLASNLKWKRALAQENAHPLLRSLSDDKDIYQKYLGVNYKHYHGNPFFIRDDRFEDIDKNIFVPHYLKNSDASNFVLYLPPEGLGKPEINRIVSKEFSHLNNPSKTLIIADIIEHEAGIYEYALESATFPERFVETFERIILVTRNLSVLVLRKTKSPNITYENDKDFHRTFLVDDPATFSPHRSMYHLMQWIKTHDSILYWRYLFMKMPFENFFFNGKIEWIKNRKPFNLNTYFNFGLTLSNQVCLQIYNVCLERVSSLYTSECNTLRASDNLVRNIIEVFNSKTLNIEQETEKTIQINSVWVTGITSANASMDNSEISISYFVNKSISNLMESTNQLHFLLWPDQNLLSIKLPDNSANLKRIGNSSFVAPFGWKYYTIPRYKHVRYPTVPINDIINKLNESGIPISDAEFASTSVASPVETYRDWQSKNLIALGHFEYGEYHDLLKIDIPYTFDESWTLNGPLICYLFSEVCRVLEIDLEVLDLNAAFKKRISEYSKNINQSSNYEKTDLIVYPYHYATEHIFRKLRSTLPDEFVDRIVPLMPIQHHSSNAPVFFSPQVIDTIKKKIQTIRSEPKNVKVVVTMVDTVKINGKTEKEVDHIMKLCGADVFHSIVLVDRQRLPMHSFESRNNSPYWKLDVPILGSRNNCVICKSIERLRYLRTILTNDLLVARLDEIIQNWKAIFRYSNANENHGIKPIEVSLRNNLTKHFGVYIKDGHSRQIGGDNNKILISDSYGLTIYCSEMLSMTMRDDLIFDFIEEENLPFEVIAESCCSLLLMFSSQISMDSKIRLLKILFDGCRDTKGVSNHTALCVITLISNQELIFSRYNEWINPDMTSFTEINNNDLLLVACQLAIVYDNNKMTNKAQIKRCLQLYDKNKLIIKEFHDALYNDYGVAHDNPLTKIKKGEVLNLFLIREAYGAIKQIRHLINSYEISLFLSNINTEYISDDLEAIDAHIEELFSKIKKIIKMNDVEFDTSKKDVRVKLTSNFNFLLDIFNQIHSKLFIPLNISSPSVFQLRSIVLEMAKESKFDIGVSSHFKKPIKSDSNIKEKWIPWNSKIRNTITDIFGNCRHFDDSTKDWREITKSTEYKRLWVSSKYNEQYFGIIFTNKVNSSVSEVIENLVREKHKPTEVYLQSIGGKLEYDDVTFQGNYYLEVTLLLPFI